MSSYFPPPGPSIQNPLFREVETPQLCQGVIDMDKGFRVGHWKAFQDNDVMDYGTETTGNIVLRRVIVPPNPTPPTVVPWEDVKDFLKYKYRATIRLNNFPANANLLSVFTQPIFAAITDPANPNEYTEIQDLVPFYNMSAGVWDDSPKIQFTATYKPPVMQDGYLIPDIIPDVLVARFFIVRNIPSLVA
jgi:hypothetical protein